MVFCKLSTKLHENSVKKCGLNLMCKIGGFMKMCRFLTFFQFPVKSTTKDNFFCAKLLCFIVFLEFSKRRLPGNCSNADRYDEGFHVLTGFIVHFRRTVQRQSAGALDLNKKTKSCSKPKLHRFC
jgi:hypothetical protein